MDIYDVVRGEVMSDAMRTRTIHWDDIASTLAKAAQMSGREYLQAMIDGRLPRAPISILIGIESMEISDGACRAALTPGEYLSNPMGAVHGGVLATLLDVVLGCALHTQLQPGEGHSTATLEVKYLRPVTTRTGTIFGEGRVVHRGRALATTDGRVLDAAGKLLATAWPSSKYQHFRATTDACAGYTRDARVDNTTGL